MSWGDREGRGEDGTLTGEEEQHKGEETKETEAESGKHKSRGREKEGREGEGRGQKQTRWKGLTRKRTGQFRQGQKRCRLQETETPELDTLEKATVEKWPYVRRVGFRIEEEEAGKGQVRTRQNWIFVLFLWQRRSPLQPLLVVWQSVKHTA